MQPVVHGRLDSHLVLTSPYPKLLAMVCQTFRLKSPEYRQAKAFGRGDPSGPEWLSFVEEYPDGTVRLPRGTVGLVKKLLADDAPRVPGLHLTLETGCAAGSPVRIDPVKTEALFARLRDYQHEGVYKVLEHHQGLIVLPCGTGKTTLGLALVLALGCTSLIVVPSIDIANQWLKGAAELGLDVGLVGNQRDEGDRDVVVGIDKSVATKVERDWPWGSRFGLALVDEAHHVPARTSQKIMGYLPALYRVGLTATPEREDGLTALEDWTMGERLLVRSTFAMIQAGYLSSAEIEPVKTGWRGPLAKVPTHAMEKLLVGDEARRGTVVQRVMADHFAKRSTLVIAGRKVYAEAITKDLQTKGCDAVCVHDKTSKKKRQQAIDDMSAGRILCFVSPKIGNEGIDWPRLSRIHLAWPGKAQGTTTQQVGRLLRLFAKDQPKLVDYVDAHPTLIRRAGERERLYRKLFG
jgi:superfamily II DNA or RNA helicase